MNESNRYKPPEAEVVDPVEKRPLGALPWVLLALLAVHTVLFAISFPNFFSNTRVGMISGMQFLLTNLNTLCLLVGGALLFFRRHAPIYLFGLATLFGLLSLSSYNFFIQHIGIALGLVGAAISVWRLRRT